MTIRNRLKENQTQWLAWMMIVLASLAISLFFGVNYPIPDQPAEPPEPIELGAHFANPVDITGSSSASAPALTFEGDTDTGLFRSAADTLNVATGGTERLEIDSAAFTIVPPVVQSIGTENVGAFPTILSTEIATDTDGALWTIADGEVWLVHQVFCNVTTNFDCTGDDCILHIGDGNDEDGLLDLDDGELQTADTEGTGAAAGWQGFMSTDTRGDYFTYANSFIYAPSGSDETIDIKLEDSSDNSDPTAGAATCYIHYTRLE